MWGGGGAGGRPHILVLAVWQCGRLCWHGDEGEGQLVQLGDFHSLERLGHKLVLLGVMTELVQLTTAQLVQLQLGVGAQDRDHDF